MATLTGLGAAIEGLKVEGHSRRPLIARDLESVILRGKRVYRYLAKEDVRAQIARELADDDPPYLEPAASTSSLDELIGESVLIQSLDRNPGEDVKHGSHTHKANFWYFHKRTSVRITLPHTGFVHGKHAG